MDPNIIQGIAGIYWFFDPRRVTEYRIALIFGITEDKVQSIKKSDAYLDAIENLMRTTRSPAEFVKWIEMETLSEISERLGERMEIDPNLIRDMIERISQSHRDQGLDRVPTIDDIINEIRSKSTHGDYIYRGERKKYKQVSSALYRECANIIDVEEFESTPFDLMYPQKEMLRTAKSHVGEAPKGLLEDFIPDNELLTELQHYGGKTNLIDFTIDYLIAIYFACSGHPEEVGRVILLSKNEEIEEMIIHPWNPRHRVIAQKSVFLQPPKGYIEVSDDNIVSIPANLKQPLLEYLRKFHGITTESIYNDIHGFIKYQNIHQNSDVQFYIGFLIQKRAREVESLKEKQKKYKETIKHYNEAIKLNPDFGGVIYCNRGEAWVHLKNWEKARKDFTIAQEMDVDIVDSFRTDYKEGVKEFEKETNIKLPSDLAEILGGNV